MATNQNGRGGFSGWLVRGLSRLLILVLAFVAGAVVMHVGMHAGDREHMQALQAQNTQLQEQLTQSQSSLAALKNEANVQSGMQQALQGKLTDLQQALGSTRDQLAFYEQLLPAGPAGSVSIRAFDVQPQGDFLHYRVLLTRSAPDSSGPFKGSLRFTALGHQNGKAVKVELSAAKAAGSAAGETSSSGTGDTGTGGPGTPAAPAGAAAPASSPLALSFDQYQRSAGLLQKVPGLVVQSVRVEVLEGDTVRATQDATPGPARNGAPADQAG